MIENVTPKKKNKQTKKRSKIKLHTKNFSTASIKQPTDNHKNREISLRTVSRSAPSRSPKVISTTVASGSESWSMITLGVGIVSASLKFPSWFQPISPTSNKNRHTKTVNLLVNKPRNVTQLQASTLSQNEGTYLQSCGGRCSRDQRRCWRQKPVEMNSNNGAQN